MDKYTLNYSTKNIPLPTKKQYLKNLTAKVEKVIKRMRWKAYFFDKQHTIDQTNKETFGFNTRRCPPKIPDLSNFESELLDMIKNISFKPTRNQFQERLIRDIKTIKLSQKAFIPADKTRNFYEMDKTSYDKLFIQNVTKTYKKADNSSYNNINNEAKSIAKKLGIDEKVECLAKPNAFITLKDRKEDFTNNPKCRLINPAKSELGKVSKVLLDNINRKVRDSSKVNQWHNTDEVIEWFENVEGKESCIFVQFDIEEFYPSISRSLLDKAISHAKKYTPISNDTLQAILHSRKSLLFTDQQAWVKKSSDPGFDVTMGSYDGAELCELVGLFILHTLTEIYGDNTCGLYRDDGLCCFHNITSSAADKIRKEITSLFKEKFDLKITIKTNLRIVDFLDVTLNLESGTYKPYSKPNSSPVYINSQSNHPPNIIKRIPSMISERISKISSNKEVFDRAAPFYNNALNTSGYKSNISYKETQANHAINSVLKVQVTSQGQRFFLENVDQGLRGGRDQFWLCIVHNAKFSGCDGHCCCHLMSSTQNIFVVLQFYLKNKCLTVEGVHK